VIKVKVLEPGTFVSSELMLIKIACKSKQHAEVLNVARLMGADVIDVATSSITLRFAGDEEQSRTLLNLLTPYGIREVVRAGSLAIEKGSGILKKEQ
jgi:acetolactate synthase-1/3 small subunit